MLLDFASDLANRTFNKSNSDKNMSQAFENRILRLFLEI